MFMNMNDMSFFGGSGNNIKIKTINGESIVGEGNIDISTGGTSNSWEMLDEVTLEEDAIPHLDLGANFPDFSKIRITATIPTMGESKNLTFFFTNTDTSVQAGYGMAYQVGTYSGTGGKTHLIEFEPVIEPNKEYLIVRSGVLGSTLTNTISYSAYDHSRILTARYFFSKQVFPADSHIKLEGIKI